MKICYDHLCFWENFGGVSRYFTELFRYIPAENRILTVRYSDNEYLRQMKDIDVHPFLFSGNFKGKARLTSEFGKLFSIPTLLKGDFDIYHPTHYDCYGLRYVPERVRTVATIHDMNFFVIPEFYGKVSGKLMKDQSKMAHRVDHIITVSENTKKDLVNIWNIPDEKITVIYHGINRDIDTADSGRPFDFPYILFVGRRSRYKNFEGMVKGFSILRKHHPDLRLVCAGSAFTKAENDFLVQNGVDGVCLSVKVSDPMLRSLYRHAEMFVFPSYYEGFGLPILEAMSNKCPVVLSDASCFPEIAREAAIYFDPSQPEDMAVAMEKVLVDSELRDRLVKSGFERQSEFSWKKCAEQHLSTYKSLIL